MRGGQGRRLRTRRGPGCRGGARGRRHLARGRRRVGGGRAARRAGRARPAAGARRDDRRPSSTWRSAPAPTSPSGGRGSSTWSRRAGRELGVRPQVHVKYDTGMGRLGERDPGVVAELARVGGREPRGRPGRRLDPLRDRRRGRRRASSSSSSSASASSPMPLRDELGRDAARRQQRRDAARAARPLRHGPLRGRDLRARPVRSRPGRAAGSSRRWSCAPTSPTSSASSPATRPATGAPGAPREPTCGRRAADRLRRRRPPRALQQRRRSWSAAAATRSSARSRWTTSPSTSAPSPRSSRAPRRS